jgi:hypothetical protein
MRSAMRSSQLSTLVALVMTAAMAAASAPAEAQTPPPKPTTQAKPRPARPSPQKPAAPAPKAAAPVEAPPPEPPSPPPPEDVHYKTAYVESVTYVKGTRERFEFQDMVLLKQHDQKRIVQISRAANTYLVAPEGLPLQTAEVPANPAVPPRPPGMVMVATTIVDTGERKTVFGQEARHVKTIIDRQPMPGACDTSKQRIETDGWYIDPPKVVASQTALAPTASAARECSDQINATHNGDPKALGFPIGYTTTVFGDDGRPSTVSMEVSEFELTTLDQALFEIPQGLNAALNINELGKALSDANEARLAAENAAPPAAPLPKRPGVVRLGVPELTNKTAMSVDTRALRTDLVDNLTEAKFEVVPLAAAAQGELQKRAAERGVDYVLVGEVTELKVSKGGGLGGFMKAASMMGGAPGAAPERPPTEATLSIKLLQPDGKARLSATAKGKDGSGLKTGLGLARFAGTMYMSMFMGPQMMSRMYRVSALTGTNMGGLGMLGNPAMFEMQSLGMGMGMGMGGGRGFALDQTAGAASFIMQQALTMNQSARMGMAGGPSFDESLAEALDNATKAVSRALDKK